MRYVLAVGRCSVQGGTLINLAVSETSFDLASDFPGSVVRVDILALCSGDKSLLVGPHAPLYHYRVLAGRIGHAMFTRV